MKFDPPLQKAQLLTRYKRFLADVKLANDEIITVHCPNTGSMKNCVVENSHCWISDSHNPKRKYRFTWELATTPCGSLAGINTGRANKLVLEAIERGVIKELCGYQSIKPEQKYGEENSRIDILLSGHPERGAEKCYVEVKSVTLAGEHRKGYFPDSVSDRAVKHMRELMVVKAAGQRAVLLFCVQHTGIDSVSPADDIHPKYGEVLRLAMAEGVEAIAYKAEISEGNIALVKRVSVVV